MPPPDIIQLRRFNRNVFDIFTDFLGLGQFDIENSFVESGWNRGGRGTETWVSRQSGGCLFIFIQYCPRICTEICTIENQ